MSPTQTKNEYLIDRIAERLGVPKPAEGQVAFAPDPLALLAALADLLTDPAQAKKSIDATRKARDAIDQAQAEQKKLEASRAEIAAEVAAKRVAFDERIANELSAHGLEMEKRTRSAETREAALAEREREADKLFDELKAARADLKRRIDAFRAATA